MTKIKQFEKLTEEESGLLFQAPILVSVLAASGNHEISDNAKAETLKLAHLKTFTADPSLLEYYREAEKDFKIYFDSILKKYAPFDLNKREELKKEINHLNEIISKLDKKFARTLHQSLSRYAEHVRKTDVGLLDDFIFPIPIKGLTD